MLNGPVKVAAIALALLVALLLLDMSFSLVSVGINVPGSGGPSEPGTAGDADNVRGENGQAGEASSGNGSGSSTDGDSNPLTGSGGSAPAIPKEVLAPVVGMIVDVYLARGKASPDWISCGRTVAVDGRFVARCEAPVDVPPGDYNLIARSLDNVVYRGSDSDPVVSLVSPTSLSIDVSGSVRSGEGCVVNVALTESVTGLPPVLVLEAGLLLVCVTLAQGAVEEHRALRKSYLERGAGREEVDTAIRGA